MTPSKNIPDTLKARFKGWPLYAVSFDALVAGVQACRNGEVHVGRFTAGKHTAYLVDMETRSLLRHVRIEPMRVPLRRVLATHAGGVTLASPKPAKEAQ